MKRIKAFFYGNPWNYIMLIPISIVVLLLSKINLQILFIIMVIVIYVCVNQVVDYKKNKKLKKDCCKNCTKKGCTLLQSEKTQFYSIKFVKCNRE